MSCTKTDKQQIVIAFVRNFILKVRRERALFELNHPHKRNLFVRRLHHSWATVIDIKKLTLIAKKVNDFDYIQKHLRLKDTELIYIISDYDDNDNEIMEFKEGFNKCRGRGMVTLLLTLDANKLYPDTEQVQGAPDKFIGKAF